MSTTMHLNDSISMNWCGLIWWSLVWNESGVDWQATCLVTQTLMSYPTVWWPGCGVPTLPCPRCDPLWTIPGENQVIVLLVFPNSKLYRNSVAHGQPQILWLMTLWSCAQWPNLLNGLLQLHSDDNDMVNWLRDVSMIVHMKYVTRGCSMWIAVFLKCCWCWWAGGDGY